MPIVSIEELRFAAQQKYCTSYQIVRLKGNKPFVAKLVTSSNGPTLYVAQQKSRVSVAQDPQELGSYCAAKLTRLLFYHVHLKRTRQQ